MGISSSCRKSNVVWYAPGKPGPSRRTESPFPSQYPVNAVVHVIISASALPSPFSFQGRERLFLLLVDSIFRGSPWYASFHTPLLISVIEIVSAKGICVDSGLELDPANGPPGSESRRNKRWPWTFALSCLSLVFCALSAIKIPSHHPPLLSPLSPPRYPGAEKAIRNVAAGGCGAEFHLRLCRDIFGARAVGELNPCFWATDFPVPAGFWIWSGGEPAKSRDTASQRDLSSRVETKGSTPLELSHHGHSFDAVGNYHHCRFRTPSHSNPT